jgi:mitochondrial fission protein ELM1
MHRSGNFSKMTDAAPTTGLSETWVITDGTAGMQAQGLAVAREIGLPYRLRNATVGGVRGLVPAPLNLALRPKALLAALKTDTAFTAPWPRVVVSVGRRSAPIALAVKRVSGGKAYALHVQSPNLPSRLFDLIAAPVHDRLTGKNVIETFGAVHSVTAERLAAAAKAFAGRFDHLPRPFIAVVLGGRSNAFDLPVEHARSFGARLAAMAKEAGGSLLITPSRRTPQAAYDALQAELTDTPHFAWDGKGDNPYLAMLSYADVIVVTGDSVNMVTEAAGTGKPVLIEPLPGKSKRIEGFHDKMAEAGATRPFQGRLETWQYEPINDTAKVAAVVRQALGL